VSEVSEVRLRLVMLERKKISRRKGLVRREVQIMLSYSHKS